MRPRNKEKEKLVEEFILKNYEYDEEAGKIYSNIGNRKEVGYVDKNNGRKKINILINNKNIHLQFHRVAYFLHYKKWPTKSIDHIDRNPLNNKISNLRECSDQENQRNSSKQKNNSSGFKNVTKHGKGWIVTFSIDNKNKYFGTYKTVEEANKIARKIEKELYGEFAPINKDL